MNEFVFVKCNYNTRLLRDLSRSLSLFNLLNYVSLIAFSLFYDLFDLAKEIIHCCCIIKL